MMRALCEQLAVMYQGRKGRLTGLGGGTVCLVYDDGEWVVLPDDSPVLWLDAKSGQWVQIRG